MKSNLCVESDVDVQPSNHNIVVDDGSKEFEDFINSRLDMTRDKKERLSAESVFARVRKRVHV